MDTRSPFIDPQPSCDVSIIILTRNRADSLLNVIRHIYAQRGVSELAIEILAIDNNSTDSTKTAVAAFINEGHPATRYLFEATVGQAFAKNLGVAHSRGRILVFTDDDVIPDEHWLISMVHAFEKFGCAGAGGRLLPAFSPSPPDWYRADIPFPYRFDFGDHPIELKSPPFGANMAFRRECFSRFGLFRTDLGASEDNPAGKGEDSDFGRRLMDAREIVMYVPEALLYHPLDAAAITREFMHKWYYQYGRSQVIRNSNPDTGIRYFGIPRHLIRALVSSTVKSLLSSDPVERFRCEMDRHRLCGIIAEDRARVRRTEKATL